MRIKLNYITPHRRPPRQISSPASTRAAQPSASRRAMFRSTVPVPLRMRVPTPPTVASLLTIAEGLAWRQIYRTDWLLTGTHGFQLVGSCMGVSSNDMCSREGDSGMSSG